MPAIGISGLKSSCPFLRPGLGPQRCRTRPTLMLNGGGRREAA